MPKNNNLATKTFVKEVVEKTEGKLRQEIESSKEELRNEIKKNHNEVMNKLDSIAGSVNKFDEEQTALSYRVSEHTDQLEDHEERIKKVEEALPPSV